MTPTTLHAHATPRRWAVFRARFEANRQRPLPPVSAPALSPEQAAALAWTLARFQVAEAAEGRVVREMAGARLGGIDDDYRQALRLFVMEEGRHARILAAAVRALGGALCHASWTERLFVHGRRLLGVRFKILVLLVAEVVGIVFYGLLASCLPAGELRAAMDQMVGDERQHLRFHRQFFAVQAPSGWRRALFVAAYTAVCVAAAAVMLWDHRRTLRRFGVGGRLALRQIVAVARACLRSPAAPSPSLVPEAAW